jgi:hypothetical protein
MKFLLIIAAFALLSGCSTASHQAEAKALFDAPPRIEMREAEVEIALTVGQFGRRYVSFDIHGKAFLFMLDTGATPTIVSDSVARHAGITTIPVPWGTIYGGGGGSSGSAGVIEELRVKGVTVSRLPVFFIDLTDWNVREFAGQQKKIDGILGSNFLEYFSASIDYNTNTLKLRRPNQTAQTTSGS